MSAAIAAFAVDLPLFLLFAVPITIYDAREYRVPDVLSIGGILAFSLLRILQRREVSAFGEIALACTLGFGSFWLIRRITRGKLGLGDAKCSALVAVSAGVYGWFVAMSLASVAGLLCAAVLIGAYKVSPRARIPFAPFLCGGGAVAIVLRVLFLHRGWGGI